MKPTRPLVIAISTEPSTLDGQAVIDRNSRVASGNIFESLLDRDRTGQIVPWLAESYRAVNDNTWRFRLRKNVKFHNGEPFDAHAAAFSVNRIIDKHSRPSGRPTSKPSPALKLSTKTPSMLRPMAPMRCCRSR